jgi:hypothetical protein
MTLFRATLRLIPWHSSTLRARLQFVCHTQSAASPSSGEGRPPHVTEKDHELDVQSHSSRQAQREREVAGQAGGKKQDPKKDHPKAPSPVIGMQDERGRSESIILYRVRGKGS